MSYIHPDDKIISEFILNNIHDKISIHTIANELLAWFDKHIQYSRLNAPFFPLQRSDLDVISMQSGTCGDYANLMVSVFQKLGYETRYAYVHKDCFGDEQDHICMAVRDGGQWILIDAALPYRKWFGFRCVHQDYELIPPMAFEEKMKKEENNCLSISKQYGNDALAGLLYAPWIHEEIVVQSADSLESVFFLLQLYEPKDARLYAYYKKYTKDGGYIPVMSVISNGTQKYSFSCKKPRSIWDDGQWSREYLEVEIPSIYKTKVFYELKKTISAILPDIDLICRPLDIHLVK